LNARLHFCSILTDDTGLSQEASDHLALLLIRRLENDRRPFQFQAFFTRGYSYTESCRHALHQLPPSHRPTFVFSLDPVTNDAPCDKATSSPACSFAQIWLTRSSGRDTKANAFFRILLLRKPFSTEVVAIYSIAFGHHTVFLIYGTGKPVGATNPGSAGAAGPGFFFGHFLGSTATLKPRCRSLKDRILLWAPSMQALSQTAWLNEGACVWHGAPCDAIPKALWLEPRSSLPSVGSCYFSVKKPGLVARRFDMIVYSSQMKSGLSVRLSRLYKPAHGLLAGSGSSVLQQLIPSIEIVIVDDGFH